MPVIPQQSQQWNPWPETIAVTSVANAGNTLQILNNAAVYQGLSKEAQRSYGVESQADITVTIGLADLTIPPKPRDQVAWNGTTYTVLDCWATNWGCYRKLSCRALGIVYALQQIGQLLRPANGVDAAGKRIPNPTQFGANIPCRVQPMTGTKGTPFDGSVTSIEGQYTAILGTTVYPKMGDIFATIDGSGNVLARYTITGWRDGERIDELMSLDLESLDGVV